MIVAAGSSVERQLSVMYLAQATGVPSPAGEVRGLVLLRPADVHQIVQQGSTLRQVRAAGGSAYLRDSLDDDWPFEPFVHVRALAQILRHHGDRL